MKSNDPTIKQKKTPEPPESITLHYNLYDLPTAQHKAGLVGMLMMIESFQLRKIEPEPLLPAIDNLTETEVDITVTPQSLQSIFDALFDTKIVERPSKQSGQMLLLQKSLK